MAMILRKLFGTVKRIRTRAITANGNEKEDMGEKWIHRIFIDNRKLIDNGLLRISIMRENTFFNEPQCSQLHNSPKTSKYYWSVSFKDIVNQLWKKKKGNETMCETKKKKKKIKKPKCAKKKGKKKCSKIKQTCLDPSKKKHKAGSKADVCKEKEDPCKEKADANKKKEDPCKELKNKIADANQKKEDPCKELAKKKGDSSKKKDDPCKELAKKKGDSSKKKEDPCKELAKKKGDSIKKKEDPCKELAKKKVDSSKKKEDPCKELAKKKGDANQKKEDPCKELAKKKGDSSKKKEDPCKDLAKNKGDASKKKEDPCSKLAKKKGDSGKKKEDPCSNLGKKKDDSNKKKEDPCKELAKKKADTSKKKVDPCKDLAKKKSDSSKKKEDPCKELAKKKADASKKKVDPCKDLAKKKSDSTKKKEDPCKKNEDPCKELAKKKADANKKKEDPCSKLAKKKDDSSKKKEDPCKELMKKKADASKKKEDPCKELKKKIADANKKKEDPCKKLEKKKAGANKNKVDPCKELMKKKGDSSKKKEDPCSKLEKKDSSKKKEDPCKKNEDPCKELAKKKADANKKKEDPCSKLAKKKGDSSKKKEDPCSKLAKNKDDSSKKKEDPCSKLAKKKGDSSKKKEDPCAKLAKNKDDSSKKKDPCAKIISGIVIEPLLLSNSGIFSFRIGDPMTTLLSFNCEKSRRLVPSYSKVPVRGLKQLNHSADIFYNSENKLQSVLTNEKMKGNISNTVIEKRSIDRGSNITNSVSYSLFGIIDRAKQGLTNYIDHIFQYKKNLITETFDLGKRFDGVRSLIKYDFDQKYDDKYYEKPIKIKKETKKQVFLIFWKWPKKYLFNEVNTNYPGVNHQLHNFNEFDRRSSKVYLTNRNSGSLQYDGIPYESSSVYDLNTLKIKKNQEVAIPATTCSQFPESQSNKYFYPNNLKKINFKSFFNEEDMWPKANTSKSETSIDGLYNGFQKHFFEYNNLHRKLKHNNSKLSLSEQSSKSQIYNDNISNSGIVGILFETLKKNNYFCDSLGFLIFWPANKDKSCFQTDKLNILQQYDRYLDSDTSDSSIHSIGIQFFIDTEKCNRRKHGDMSEHNPCYDPEVESPIDNLWKQGKKYWPFYNECHKRVKDPNSYAPGGDPNANNMLFQTILFWMLGV